LKWTEEKGMKKELLLEIENQISALGDQRYNGRK
jgi:hypothetical protein